MEADITSLDVMIATVIIKSLRASEHRQQGIIIGL